MAREALAVLTYVCEMKALCPDLYMLLKDYYEALEVLNQHEFISKSVAREDVELLGEGIECSQEPLEEGDLSNDTENLSEVEGDDYENPRIR